MSARISVRISEEIAEKLARHAAASGRRSSDLVREALEAFLGHNDESCFELAKKSKLVGAVRNAPRDLSANRDYFEGFGQI